VKTESTEVSEHNAEPVAETQPPEAVAPDAKDMHRLNRLKALQFAVLSSGRPDDVVKAAQKYFDFLEGKSAPSNEDTQPKAKAKGKKSR
jgi:hypothetical protein